MQLSLKDHLSEKGLDKWRVEIGCTNAAIPRRNIRVALAFFDAYMPGLPIGDALGFLVAMDLSKPVERVNLAPGLRLIGYRTQTESPFKLFFTRRGNSPERSGINTAGRGPVHFTVRTSVVALESFTTGAIDSWTRRQPGQQTTVAPRAKKWFGVYDGVMAAGGGTQLIIPQSFSHLLLEHPGP